MQTNVNMLKDFEPLWDTEDVELLASSHVDIY